MPVKQGSGSRKSGKVFGQGQKHAKMVRAALYARVSTQDQQTLPMQNRAMREYAARRGWAIAMQVKEVGSGALQRQRRENLIEAARRREIDVVLVWRLDRWGRSVTDLLDTLQELEHLGIGLGRKRSGHQSVDADLVRPQLGGEMAGQLQQRRLGRSIMKRALIFPGRIQASIGSDLE